MNLAEWLRGLGLQQYESAFRENDIGSDVLPNLTADDLRDIGVRSVGHRRRLLDAIAVLRAPSSPAERNTEAVASDKGPSNADAERRQLTVLFCDLVGSTALSARLDPEDLRKIIGAYHSRVASVIERFQGFVAKYMGDGVLAYFGYPRAHEDDAEQAVRAALALVDAVGHIAAIEPLRVRIGIATGLVVVGDLIGAGPAREHGVVGETPNLAARLQALAEPNTIVISAATRRLTGRLFDYVDIGEMALAGFASPVRVWRVVGASDTESRFEARHEAALTPLVGREEELALLLGRWRRVLEGEGRVVLLIGEAGIGKSRLASALLDRIGTESHLRLRYFCSPHHQESALFPFKEQLMRAAGFLREDLAEVKSEKLASLLARVKPEPDATEFIAALLSLPIGGRYAVPNLSPQQRKARTYEALLTQVLGLAAQRPVVMLFEDVHWIDPSSLELLTLAIERAQRARVLILITARPEFRSPWSSAAHVSTFSVSRLSRREGSLLVGSVTDRKPLPPEILERILNSTDGVPLFVEELTKSVVESGVLVDAGDHYAVAGPLSPLTIPETLHDSLVARLDRLGPDKEIAQIAACVGREFDYDLLASIAGRPEESLRASLDQLRQADLIIATGLRGGRGYRFRHALVRDAAYAGLLRSRRAQLHQAIATALENDFPEIFDAQPEVVAYHLTEAGLADKAVGYWLKAGKNAAARSANLEAIAHLRRGISLLTSFPEGSAKDRLELDFQAMLGPCLIATEGPLSGAALDTFARARDLCDRLDEAPEYLQVVHWLGMVRALRGELPQALEVHEAAIGRAQSRGDKPGFLNSARGSGLVLMLMGRLDEALDLGERAAATFEASSEAEQLAARAAGQDAGVANLAVTSWALWARGFPDRATARIGAALDRANAIGHPHSEAYACYYASVLHLLRREPTVAQQHAARCLALSEQHGFAWGALARIGKAISAGLIDHSSSALDEARNDLEAYMRRGLQLGLTALYVLLCDALLSQGHRAAAEPLLAKGIEMTHRNSERIFEAELYRLSGRANLVTGLADTSAAAQSLLEEALATARRQRAHALELRTCCDLAQIWRAAGRADDARKILAPVYGSFTEGLDTLDLKEARALLESLE